MYYHMRSKGSFPPILTENCKENMKVTNAKVIRKTIEKKCLSDKLVLNLAQKIKKLEEELLDMCE